MAKGGIDATAICYLVVLIAAIVLIVMGFMDLLKKRQKDETTEGQVISRQIRGFALIMLAQVVMVLGAMLCFGMSGGVKELGASVKKMTKDLT